VWLKKRSCNFEVKKLINNKFRNDDGYDEDEEEVDEDDEKNAKMQLIFQKKNISFSFKYEWKRNRSIDNKI